MVTLIGSDGEKRVVLRDAVSGEPIEELFEGVVIGGKLRLVVGLAGTGGADQGVIIGDVREIGIGDWHAVLLHLRDVPEGVGRKRPIESGEARLPEWVGDRLAIHVVHRGTSVVDSRIDVLRAEETFIADVAVWFIRELVGPGIGGVGGVRRTDATAIRTVDGDADEVSLSLRSSRRSRRRSGGSDRFIPFG